MKVWITKYALTKGIMEREAVMSSVSTRTIHVGCDYYHQPFWHTSRSEALRHARELRTKKLASLHKTIKRIEAITF